MARSTAASAAIHIILWLLKFSVHTRLPDLRHQRRSHAMSIPRILTFVSTTPRTRMDIAQERGLEDADI
jgi:hypothetical protein